MTVVTGTALDSAKEPIPCAQIRFTLVTGTPNGPGYTSLGELYGTSEITADNRGIWSIDLTPTNQIAPADTYYQVQEGLAVSIIQVPDSGGPYEISTLLVTTPPTPSAPGITGVQVAAGGTIGGSRPEINFVAGTGIGVSVDDDPSNNRVDVTLTSFGGAPVSSVNGFTGAVVLQAGDVGAIPSAAEGAANGIATLDANSALPATQGANLFSRQIYIPCNGLSSSKTAPVGAWAPIFLRNTDTGNFVGWVNESDGAQNDQVSFDFACGAGTYSLELFHLPFTNRGIYTVKIDNTSVGTVDGYAGSLSPQRAVLAGIAIGGGQHVVTLLMASKNASASSYIGMVEHIVLTRTA